MSQDKKTEKELQLTESDLEVTFNYNEKTATGKTQIKLVKPGYEGLSLVGSHSYRFPKKYRELSSKRTAQAISYMFALADLLKAGGKVDSEDYADFAMECRISEPLVRKDAEEYKSGKHDMFMRIIRLRKNGSPERVKMLHISKEGEVSEIDTEKGEDK